MTSRARKASVTRASGNIRGMKWVIGSALAAIPAGALAQADAPVETVGPGTTIGIAFFLAVAVLIVVSFLCKLLVFAGLVPSNKKSLLRRVILWVANVAGEVRVTKGRNDGGGDSRVQILRVVSLARLAELPEIGRWLTALTSEPWCADPSRPPPGARRPTLIATPLSLSAGGATRIPGGSSPT